MAENKNKTFTHRISSGLFDGIQKGYNTFFFHGVGITDVFLYNYYYGILSLKETFKRIYLDENYREDSSEYEKTAPIAEFFIYSKGESIFECWEKIDDKYSECTESFFSVEQDEDDFSGIHIGSNKNNLDNKKEKDSEKTNAERQIDLMASQNQKNKNNWQNLLEKINEKKKMVGIFIEDVQWLINIYASNQDANLNYIKILQELIKNKYVILSLSIHDTELLKRYGFDFDGKNTIFVGHPTVQEVKYSFLRQFMNKTSLTEIQPDILTELNKISAGIVAGKNSLRAAMRIFRTTTNNNTQYQISYDDFKNSFAKTLSEEVTLDQVILSDNTKKAIVEAVDNFLNDEENGKKGLILSGPPGTGKTLIAKAIAREKDCYFMAPSLSDLKGEYVGQTSGKVKRIFDEARASQPTILFIDEADTIFPSRDLAGSTSDSFNLDMVNQFLVEIDGAKTGNQKIFLIAATNRPEILDSAIKSRLGIDIPFYLPDKSKRITIFEKKLQKYNISFKDKPFADDIADKTENMSGRDIDNFVKTLSEESRTKHNLELASLNDEELNNIFYDTLQRRVDSMINDLNNRKIAISITHPKNLKSTNGWKSIIGYERIKSIIDRQAKFLKATWEERNRAKNYGVEASRGILLYGPPGNGKSMLAASAAKEHNLYFVKVLSKDFASINPDVTLTNLQLIFSEVLKLSKMCSDVSGILLFFDEYDSLASKAQLSSTVRGTLLDYIADNEKRGLRDDNGKILFMAATNFMEDLDEALIRKGRIDEHCFMDNPYKKDAEAMIKTFIQKKPNTKVPEDSLCALIYDKLFDQKKDIERQKLEKVFIDSSKIENSKVLEQYIENKARPSAVDLEDIVDKLVAEAYDKKSFHDNMLVIEKKIIDAVFIK